jgi:hypothetical protein
MIHIFLIVFLASTEYVSAAACEGKVCNPLNDAFSTVPGFIAGLAKVAVILAIPLVALALLYAGFLFVAARGKGDKLTTAKNNFKFVILGATLILGAWAFASMLWGTIGQIISGQGGSQTTIPRSLLGP